MARELGRSAGVLDPGPPPRRLADPARLARLAVLEYDDPGLTASLERLARLATRLLGAPTALVSAVEASRQVFLGADGLAPALAQDGTTDLDRSFCRYVVAEDQPLVVPDARRHPALRDNPAVTDGAIAYAGVPLHSPDGHVLGSFCAVSGEPHDWRDGDVRLLHDLAAAAETEIALRLAHHEVALAQRRTTRILDTAQDAYIALDAGGRIQAWNAAAARLLGWRAEEVLGRSAADVFVPAELREAHRAGLERVRRTGRSSLAGRRLELPAVARDGREFPVELTLEALLEDGPEGGVTFHGFLHDISDRKAAEAELTRERTFLSGLLDSLDVGVVACDAEGRFALSNRALHQVHKLPQRPIGSAEWPTLPNLFGADGRTRLDRSTAPLGRALAGEHVQGEEIVLRPPGEAARRFTVNGRRIDTEGGTTLGAVVAIHDVTEQHRGRQVSEAYAAFTDALSAAYDDPADPADPTGGLGAAVAALADGLGCRRGDLWEVDGAPAHRHGWAAPGETLSAGGAAGLVARVVTDSAPQWELSGECADGFPRRWLAGPVRSGDEVCAVLVLADDEPGPPAPELLAVLTAAAAHAERHLERRRADALDRTLREEREAHNRVRSLVQDYIWTVEILHGGGVRSVFANRNAAGVFGQDLPLEEDLGQTMASRIVPEDLPVFAGFHEQVSLGRTADVEVRVRGLDDRVRWVWTRGVPRWEDDRLFVDGVSTNVTERRELAEQRERLLAQEQQQVRRLQDLDRLKDEFLAMVSHELRNPVAVIRGYADLLKADPTLSERGRNALLVIERRTHQLRDLVDELFDHAQLEAGLVELKCVPVDLDALVEEVVTGRRGAAADAGVTLQVDLGAGRELPGDPARLRQVLDNVIGNAVKYTPAGGSVTVRTGVAGPAAVVEVADTGIGVAPEEYPRLFERLFRGSSARAHDIAGTGLGLAVTKTLVEAHGGAIDAHPNPGGGTVFTLRLPLP